MSGTGSLRALSQELKSLKDEPLEGFRVRLINDSNMFDWEVAIFGPPQTIYEGGYFKAKMHFPADYPFSPPTLRFDRSTMLYHPNVYESGDVCISILHPPVNDPHSGELPCERWNPTQNVRTILLSVVSLLNEPNTSSPANVDASVMYRRWKESNGKDDVYEKLVKGQVAASKIEAEKDGVVVPTSLDEYVVKQPNNTQTKSSFDMSFYEDDDDHDDYDNMDSDLNESGEMVASIEEDGQVGDGSKIECDKGGESHDENTTRGNDDGTEPMDHSGTADNKNPVRYSYKFKIHFK